MRWLLWLVVVPVLACGPSTEPRLSSLTESIFVPRCATGGCHDAVGAAGDLVLTGADLHSRLVNRPARAAGAVEQGWQLVVPGDPDRSFLLRKLAPGLPVSLGVMMPADGTHLTVEQRGLVQMWIGQGAHDD